MGSIIMQQVVRKLIGFEDREDATRTEGLAKFVDGFFDQRSIKTDVVGNEDMGEQRAQNLCKCECSADGRLVSVRFRD